MYSLDFFLITMQGGKSETSSTPKFFGSKREYEEVHGSMMGVRESTVGVRWEYGGSTWEYGGSTIEYGGSTMGVREYGSLAFSPLLQCQ